MNGQILAPVDGLVNFEQLNKIIQSTIEAIENGKYQVFEMTEGAHNECKLIEKELVDIKQQVAETINQVEQLQKSDKKARTRLMIVCRDFNTYSEEEVSKAYQEALEIGMKLAIAREKEKQLRVQRDGLERRLVNIREMVVKAELMVSKISTALELLTGNLSGFSTQIEGMQQRQELNFKIIKAQEEERRRVSREIHDGPAQSIANVIFRAEICEKLWDNDIDAAKKELQDLKVLLRNTLQDVRRIIFDLRPMVLDDLGLVPTLRRTVEDLKAKTDIDIVLTIIGNERRLHQAIEVATFRLVQEALNNCIKHAAAMSAKIKLEFRPERLMIVVEDDGKGFDREAVYEKLKKAENFGIVGMQERASLLGGSCEFKTAIGQGTKVIIQLPIQE